MVRAHAWVADSIPRWGTLGRQPISVSLSPFLFLKVSGKFSRVRIKKKSKEKKSTAVNFCLGTFFSYIHTPIKHRHLLCYYYCAVSNLTF